MEKLEQILYQSQVFGEKGTTLQIANLMELGAVVLYSGDVKISSIKPGVKLCGGLEIKKVGRNTVTLQEDFGGVGNIYSLHPDGHGSLKFYGLGKGKDRESKIRSW